MGSVLCPLAKEGADVCLSSDEHTVAQIIEAPEGLGAMAVLDFVGIDATLAMVAQSARRMGWIIVVGIGGGVFPFSFTALPHGSSIMTAFGCTTSKLEEVVALAEAGKVKPVIQRFPMAEVESVYEKLQKNEINGRAVLIP